MGFAPAALIWPFWRGLHLTGVQSPMRRAVLLLLLATALGLEWKALPGRTPAITGPDAIAVLESVQIGGMTQ